MHNDKEINDWIAYCTQIVHVKTPSELISVTMDYHDKNKNQATWALNRVMRELGTVGTIHLKYARGAYGRLNDADREEVLTAIRDASAFLPVMKRAIITPSGGGGPKVTVPGVLVEYESEEKLESSGGESVNVIEVSDVNYVSQALYHSYNPPHFEGSDAVATAQHHTYKSVYIANFMQSQAYSELSASQMRLIKEEWMRTLLR